MLESKIRLKRKIRLYFYISIQSLKVLKAINEESHIYI
jgi:hypothetical protein